MAPRKATGKGKQGDSTPKRPRVRGSSSQGGFERENEEVEPRFISKEAQNLYYQVLRSEVLIPSMQFDWLELDLSEYAELFTDIKNLGLKFVLGFTEDIYEDMVREFYANLELVRNNADSGAVLKSVLQGQEILISEENLSEWLELPTEGVRPRASLMDFNILRHENGDTDEEAEANFGYTEEQGTDLIDRFCSDPSTPHEAVDLPLKVRLLHYAINRAVYPKIASNNHITSLDKEIIWHMVEGRNINFPSLIIQMMRKKLNLLKGEQKGKMAKHKGMPYAAMITLLAKLHNVDFSSYEHYPYPSSWRFTLYNIKSMKLVKTVEKGWVYYDHVDKFDLTLEEDQQEPRRQGSKRDRPTSSRPSTARLNEVVQKGFQEMRDQFEELNDRVDEQQSMLLRLEATVNEQQSILKSLEKSIKKIFDKLGCRHDDASPPS